MSRRLEIIVITGLVVLFYLWFAWPLVWSASDNLRLVDAFDVDEGLHLVIVKEALQKHSFRLAFNNYGHLYFNLTLIPLFILDRVTDVTEQHMIVALRLVPALFAIAAVVVGFLLARRYFGKLAAWLTAFFLCSVPLLFLEFSVLSHPDIPQVFFMVCGVYAGCRLMEEGHWRWLNLGSVAAGLAFASKYSGLFLLPVIWTIALVHAVFLDRDKIDSPAFGFTIHRMALSCTLILGILCLLIGIVVSPDVAARYFTGDGRVDDISKLIIIKWIRIMMFLAGVFLLTVSNMVIFSVKGRGFFRIVQRIDVFVFRIIISVFVFGLTFFIASPYLFLGLNFMTGILFESRHTAVGHTFREMPNKLMWITSLTSPLLIGKFLFYLVIIRLGISIVQLFRKGWKRLWTPEFVVWGWIFLYLSFLVFRVNMVRHHYLLPVLPFLILLSVLPIKQGMEFAIKSIPRKLGIVLAVILVLTACGIALFPSFQRLVDFRRERMARGQTSSEVEAGRWLEAHYRPTTRILYDRYSYVPPKFQDVEGTFLATAQTVEEFQPDIIVTNKHGQWPFEDIEMAGLYVLGEGLYKQRYAYYQSLRDGSAGYRLLKDWGDVQIYCKDSLDSE